MSTKALLHKYLGPDAAGGHANFFDPGTSTPKRTYTSTTYSTEEELDVPISSDGWIKTYLLGDYDMDVFDKTGTQLPSASADGINPQAASVANDPNLVVNGSFETDSDEDGTPDSWVLTEFAGSTNSRVSSDQRHGAHAMSFTSTGAGGGYLTTEDFIAVNPDVPMYIGFAIRSTVADVRNVVDILWFTESEATVSTTSVYDEDTNNPTSWEFRSFHATPPATAAYAKIRIYGCHSSDSTNGTTLYDDVQFRPAFGNIGIAGNTISSENTNGDINLTPNGTGEVTATVIANTPDNIPVSTTSGGGTAGIDYDVADWPDTLVSGRTYYARAHTTNQGSYSIDPGGGAITVLQPDDQATKPLDLPDNTVMGFYYDGTNLIQTFIPKRPIFRTSASTSTDAWTRLARVTFTAQSAFCMLELRLNNISRRYGMDVICELFQSAALGSNPSGFVLTKMVTGETNTIFMHDKVALHYSTVSGTESVVDVYWTGSGSALAQSDLDPRRITIQDSANVKVQFYESQGTDTEANIVSPASNFNVTSQAARGEVVAEESFSIGGDFSDTGFAKSVRGDGGNWVSVHIPNVMSHSSSSAPSSGTGDIPAAYRPSSVVSVLYSHSPLTAADKTNGAYITSSGTLSFLYITAGGEPASETSTAEGFSFPPYFVSD